MTTPYIDPASVQVPGVGTPLSSSWCNTVRDNLETLARAPGCVVVRLGPQNVTVSAYTPIQFSGSDERDTDAYHSPSVDASKIKIPAGLGGWYAIAAEVQLAGQGTGSALISAAVNGVDRVRLDRKPGASGVSGLTLNGYTELRLFAGDALEVTLWHNAGSTTQVTGARLSARLVAWQ